MFLKSDTKSPPGDWRFYQEQTDFWLVGVNRGALLSKVAQHRANQKLPPVSAGFSSLVEEVEASICSRLSPQSQAQYCKDGKRGRTSVSWRQLAEFVKTAAVWVAQGAKLVPQEEAERRASICANCPYNSTAISGCSSCRDVINEFKENVLHRSTLKDEKLQACLKCGCENKSTVHLPLSSLETVEHDFSAASWCWRNKRSVNYRREALDLSA